MKYQVVLVNKQQYLQRRALTKQPIKKLKLPKLHFSKKQFSIEFFCVFYDQVDEQCKRIVIYMSNSLYSFIIKLLYLQENNGLTYALLVKEQNTETLQCELLTSLTTNQKAIDFIAVPKRNFTIEVSTPVLTLEPRPQRTIRRLAFR